MQDTFSFLIWNIGYAGLGQEMDFFYDGGRETRPTKEQSEEYLGGIKEIISNQKTADFIFLQEVDVFSKRSWYKNEFKEIAENLPNFSGTFTPNYDCKFVPAPIRNPMGRVLSGLASFSQIKPKVINNFYFKSQPAWPKRLFFLKRCYTLLRFDLGIGKDLVLLNIHNSAFESGKTLRKKELADLDSLMRPEYERGNYVIAGEIGI